MHLQSVTISESNNEMKIKSVCECCFFFFFFFVAHSNTVALCCGSFSKKSLIPTSMFEHIKS